MATEKQIRLLNIIKDYIAEHQGVSPSYQDLMDKTGEKSKSSVHQMLIRLEEHGLIKRGRNKKRAIEVLKQP